MIAGSGLELSADGNNIISKRKQKRLCLSTSIMTIQRDAHFVGKLMMTLSKCTKYYV